MRCKFEWDWVTFGNGKIINDTQRRAAILRLTTSYEATAHDSESGFMQWACPSVCLFVCLSVCLSPKCKNAIFSKIKQFRAMVSIDDQ